MYDEERLARIRKDREEKLTDKDRVKVRIFRGICIPLGIIFTIGAILTGIGAFAEEGDTDKSMELRYKLLMATLVLFGIGIVLESVPSSVKGRLIKKRILEENEQNKSPE